jgi:hypothetical protein
MDSSEILRKAADVISERGHGKLAFGNDESGHPVCAHGAIKVALGLTTHVSPQTDEEASLEADAINALAREIMESGRTTFQSSYSPPMRYYAYAFEAGMPEEIVWDFNDTGSTSAEDVILMMKRAAEHGS